jgi:hypothetical protein
MACLLECRLRGLTHKAIRTRFLELHQIPCPADFLEAIRVPGSLIHPAHVPESAYNVAPDPKLTLRHHFSGYPERQ